ncbi:hypothetical protein H6F71_04000 [Microcoleus sp. FACHB-61]|nr:hypothetical protein [Microcoleus sp. FACHB-61]
MTLALILPSTLSIELSDADNPVNLTPDFCAKSSFEPISLAPVGDRVHLCYIF